MQFNLDVALILNTIILAAIAWNMRTVHRLDRRSLERTIRDEHRDKELKKLDTELASLRDSHQRLTARQQQLELDLIQLRRSVTPLDDPR